MPDTLAKLAAAINKARGAWIATLALGTLASGGLFALALFVASENVAGIKQLRQDILAHEARIARLEGASVAKQESKGKP